MIITPKETYGAFNPPTSLERMEHDREQLGKNLARAKQPPVKKTVMLPGPPKQDKNFYGALQPPPPVRVLKPAVALAEAKKHREYGGSHSRTGEKIIPGPAAQDHGHYGAFNPPALKIADVPLPTASHGGKHPEFGSASTKKSGVTYGPQSPAPTVDIHRPKASPDGAWKHPEYGGRPAAVKGEKLYPGDQEKSGKHYSPFDPPPAVDLHVALGDKKKRPQFAAGSKRNKSGEMYGPLNHAPKVDVRIHPTPVVADNDGTVATDCDSSHFSSESLEI